MSPSKVPLPVRDLDPSPYLISSASRFAHFVTQRPSDPEIQKPGDSVDPVTLFYNELQMSKKYSQAEEFLIIIGKSTSSLHGLTSSDFSPTTDT